MNAKLDVVTAMKRSSRIIFGDTQMKAKVIPNKKRTKLDKIRRKEVF